MYHVFISPIKHLTTVFQDYASARLTTSPALRIFFLSCAGYMAEVGFHTDRQLWN